MRSGSPTRAPAWSDEARRTFVHMLSLDGESPMALENLARALDLERGDYANAALRFERAVTLDPTSSQSARGTRRLSR